MLQDNSVDSTDMTLLIVGSSELVILLLNVGLLCIIPVHPTFITPLGAFTCICVLIYTAGYLCLRTVRTPTDGVCLVFYLIIVGYTMIPQLFYMAIIYGLALSLLQLLVAGLLSNSLHEHLFYQVGDGG